MGKLEKCVSSKKVALAVMPAKCQVTKAPFEITLENKNGKMVMIEGHKIDNSKKFVENVKLQSPNIYIQKMEVSEGIYAEPTYHCPVCGNKQIVRCGKCHNITCYDGSGKFECAHCGNKGEVSGKIKEVNAETIKKRIKKPDKNEKSFNFNFFSGK